MMITIKQVTEISWFSSAYKSNVYTIVQYIKYVITLHLKKKYTDLNFKITLGK